MLQSSQSGFMPGEEDAPGPPKWLEMQRSPQFRAVVGAGAGPQCRRLEPAPGGREAHSIPRPCTFVIGADEAIVRILPFFVVTIQPDPPGIRILAPGRMRRAPPFGG